MSEIRRDDDPEAKIEHDAAELDERLHRLEDHISDAEKAADARREEAEPGEEAAANENPEPDEDPARASRDE